MAHQRQPKIRRLIKDGKSMSDIAAELGMSLSALSHYCRRHQLTPGKTTRISSDGLSALEALIKSIEHRDDLRPLIDRVRAGIAEVGRYRVDGRRKAHRTEVVAWIMAGKTTAEIVQITGTSRGDVATIRRELKAVATPPRRGRRSQLTDKVLSLRQSGLTYEEIAAKVGCVPNSVYRIIAKARKMTVN